MDSMLALYEAASGFQPRLGDLLASRTLLVLLLLTCLHHLLRAYLRLRNVPGPLLAKFTDLYRAGLVKTGHSHTIHQAMHKKYGALVRLGPNMVSIADPVAIPSVYPMRPGFPKSAFYDAFVPYTKGGAKPGIFMARDEDVHKGLKSPIASLYSLSSAVRQEPSVNNVMDVLFKQLDQRFADSHTPFDLSDWLQYFAFDVMGAMTFSERYGFLDSGADEIGMLATMWKSALASGPMTQVPWLDKLLYKNALAAGLKKASGSVLLEIAAENVSRRKRELDQEDATEVKRPAHRDFLDEFLQIQSENKSIPPWSSLIWTFSNIVAGGDSTAVVMRTTMFHILAHPKSIKRVYEELLEQEKTQGLSRPYPAWHDISNLPYLNACVNEAIRIHPPFCLPLERVVPKGGVTVCGQFLPNGTVVGMNPYVVNRHRPTFGEDADEWRPERWLEGDEEQRRLLAQSIMTFGAGRRVCLGKYLALLEVKKVVSALVLNYEFDLLDPKNYVTENSFFFRQRGILVRAKRRGARLCG